MNILGTILVFILLYAFTLSILSFKNLIEKILWNSVEVKFLSGVREDKYGIFYIYRITRDGQLLNKKDGTWSRNFDPEKHNYEIRFNNDFELANKILDRKDKLEEQARRDWEEAVRLNRKNR